MKYLKDKRAAGILAAVIIVLALVLLGSGGGRKSEFQKFLDLGNQYLEEMDYESAIVAFDQAIVIEPKDQRGYYGKACAQYALNLVDDALETIYTGLEMAESIDLLQELLEVILEEPEITEAVEVSQEMTGGSGEAFSRLFLNYFNIVRFTNTEEPQIQLEVLGENAGGGNYSWYSDNEDCATVSENGLLTCMPNEGTAFVTVEDENGNSACCIVHIISEENAGMSQNESEGIMIDMGNGQYLPVTYPGTDEMEMAVSNYASYIYYSGDVTIPDHLTYRGQEFSVTTIGDNSFIWCKDMESIFLPASVTSLEEGMSSPFLYCENLKEITVDEGNETYKSVDGVLFTKDGKTLITYPAAKQEESYVLPAEVEYVCSGAFAGADSLKEILVADGNTSYDSVDGVLVETNSQMISAYPGGKLDEEYMVPEGTRAIASYAFFKGKLRSVDFHGTIDTLYSEAFYECENLEEIKGMDRIETIFIGSSGDISGCYQLKRIELGEAITRVSCYEYDYVTDAHEVELIASSPMENLRQMGIYVDDLKDMEWITKFQSLQTLELKVKTIQEMDLSPLMSLENAEEISINVLGSNRDETELDEEQLQALAVALPECQISINGYSIEELISQ